MQNNFTISLASVAHCATFGHERLKPRGNIEENNNTKNIMSKAVRSNYKGSPTLTLDADSRFPFSFGAKKAHLILAHLEDIRRFCADHPQAAEPARPDRFDMQNEDNMARAAGVA